MLKTQWEMTLGMSEQLFQAVSGEQDPVSEARCSAGVAEVSILVEEVEVVEGVWREMSKEKTGSAPPAPTSIGPGDPLATNATLPSL
jgi:hypothetical protein